LLPTRLAGGLFAEHCWLHGRGKKIALSRQPSDYSGTDGLLPALAQMLEEGKAHLGKNNKLSLTVSDSLFLACVLPWQEALSKPAEWASYARIYFEQRGAPLTEEWVLQTHFRHYGKPGMAYAVRRQWLEELLALLGKYGVQLQSVLPACAAAYCRPPSLQKGKTLLLLREQQRVSALSYQDNDLQALDVEPLVVSETATGARLLRRLAAGTEPPGNIWEWSPVPMAQRTEGGFISAELPAATVHRLPHEVWK
jgi:hypothetical protein